MAQMEAPRRAVAGYNDARPMFRRMDHFANRRESGRATQVVGASNPCRVGDAPRQG